MKRRSRSRLSEFTESGVGTQGALASFSSTHDANKARQTAGSVSCTSGANRNTLSGHSSGANHSSAVGHSNPVHRSNRDVEHTVPMGSCASPDHASPSNLGDRTGIVKRRNRHRLRGRNTEAECESYRSKEFHVFTSTTGR